MRGRLFLVAAAALLAGLAVGLFLGLRWRVPSMRPVESVAPRPASRDAERLGMLVQAEMLSDASAANEPRSDVDGSGRVAKVYGRISRVSTGSITFDAEQYFTGAAAHRQAKLDGSDDESLESYTRNRYVHPQMIEADSDVPVFVQVVGDDTLGGYGPDWAQAGAVVTFSDFASRFQTDIGLPLSGYWILISEGRLLGIEQVVAP